MSERILVIKRGALGDVIQALGAMKAIRRHHPQARITLMTTTPFAAIGKACGYFDDMHLDDRKVGTLLALFRRRRFTRVYDLQNNDRTSLYCFLNRLVNMRGEWVGASVFASHRNSSPLRSAGTAFEGHVQTLGLAGVTDVQPDRMEWARGQDFAVPSPYALIIAGASATRPRKRWPVEAFATLCQQLLARGIKPVLIGASAEAPILAQIESACVGVLNLCGKTALLDLPALARNARFTIGNDTGPLHLAAATGCFTLVLFNLSESNPKQHLPLGENVTYLTAEEDMASITIDQVMQALAAAQPPPTGPDLESA